ncbi:hypothetical protein RRG08_049650 [Elysia crispata]|uniref:UHRF1-binding protein 1-like n=1 Tax=Elysia crispata TaxID=231223 RepID=A0AAE0Y602_9GAST|nr:hypothetical protein RRG08_049650 [Elysia crispata]
MSDRKSLFSSLSLSSSQIQWTKLKSQPICLYLDEVVVETETCEYPRAPNSQSQQAAGGKYGFVDRVMDGIYVHVNSVLVKLMSHKFHASLQLSRVKVQSMSPTWQAPSDLRSTRIREPSRGEVLLFKEIEWQTTRIEATASGAGHDFLTPLRLIANQAKIRIVVKKRLSDSAIISSRLTLLLDDLLWVLTTTQLKAAIMYANSLKIVIERSAQQSKRLAAEKLKKQGHMPDSASQQLQQHHQQQQRLGQDRQETSTARYFSRFDVLSTSYHLITSRFDLHLCDDSSPGHEENRHWKINGGSMQITFNKLSLDFYPFHPAEIEEYECGERKAWYRYSDNVGSRNPWVNKLFANFREEAVRLRSVCDQSELLAGLPSSNSAPSLLAVQPVGGAPPGGGGGGGRQRNLAPGMSHSGNSSPVHISQTGLNPLGSRSAQASPKHQPPPRSTRLLETCVVIKVEDVTVYMVSMPGQKRTGPTKLVSSDKRQLHLPPDMSVLHVEFTDYFFPDGLQYPGKTAANALIAQYKTVRDKELSAKRKQEINQAMQDNKNQVLEPTDSCLNIKLTMMEFEKALAQLKTKQASGPDKTCLKKGGTQNYPDKRSRLVQNGVPTTAYSRKPTRDMLDQFLNTASALGAKQLQAIFARLKECSIKTSD